MLGPPTQICHDLLYISPFLVIPCISQGKVEMVFPFFRVATEPEDLSQVKVLTMGFTCTSGSQSSLLECLLALAYSAQRKCIHDAVLKIGRETRNQFAQI